MKFNSFWHRRGRRGGGRALALALFLMPLMCLAQNPPGQAADSGKTSPRAIQDNSFLVEEAYNQELGVVQHISNFQQNWSTHDWFYTFTQEWPVDPRPRHQLSYTIALVRPGASLASGGLGDIALNYRYQLVGNGDARVAFAPRFSVLLPTGDYHLGRGAGGVGLQVSLPLSVVVTRKLVTHWNLGTTLVPGAKNGLRQKAPTYGYNLGQSFVWLVRPRLNLLLETVWVGSEKVVGPGQTQRSHTLLISPGVRWAYNLAHGLQIVPGIGVPLGVGPSAGERGVFLYLSFEHPFHRGRNEAAELSPTLPAAVGRRSEP